MNFGFSWFNFPAKTMSFCGCCLEYPQLSSSMAGEFQSLQSIRKVRVDYGDKARSAVGASESVKESSHLRDKQNH